MNRGLGAGQVPAPQPNVQLQVRQTILPVGRNTKDLRVLVVSWNTEGLSLCESNNERTVLNNRGFLRLRGPCERPTFFENIRDKIKESRADLVVVSTQHEKESSYFHSDYLPMALGELNFIKVKVEPYKYVDKYGSTLRMSIYAYSDLNPKVLSVRYQFRTIMGGAIVSFLQILDKEFAFIAVQTAGLAPVYVETEGVDITDHDSLTAAQTAVELIQLVTRTVHKRHVVNYWFFGDFGTSVVIPGYDFNTIVTSIQYNGTGNWVDFDTMSLIKQFPSLSLLQEGLTTGAGTATGKPGFGPIFPLSPKRGRDCLGDKMESTCFVHLADRVGWPNRILYTGNVACTQYNRFNSGSIADSDTDMIYGIFNLN